MIAGDAEDRFRRSSRLRTVGAARGASEQGKSKTQQHDRPSHRCDATPSERVRDVLMRPARSAIRSKRTSSPSSSGCRASQASAARGCGAPSRRRPSRAGRRTLVPHFDFTSQKTIRRPAAGDEVELAAGEPAVRVEDAVAAQAVPARGAPLGVVSTRRRGARALLGWAGSSAPATSGGGSRTGRARARPSCARA